MSAMAVAASIQAHCSRPLQYGRTFGSNLLQGLQLNVQAPYINKNSSTCTLLSAHTLRQQGTEGKQRLAESVLWGTHTTGSKKQARG